VEAIGLDAGAEALFDGTALEDATGAWDLGVDT